MISYDFQSKINTDSSDSIPTEIQKVVDLLSNYGPGCGRIIEVFDNAVKVTSQIKNFKVRIDVTSLKNGYNQSFENVKDSLSRFLDPETIN